MGRLVLVCLLLVLIPTSAALARTWYITPEGTGDAPTIVAGVDSASHGDVLLLADGVFVGDGNRDINVGKTLTIASESGDPRNCIIDCDGAPGDQHRGFIIDAPVTLEGITIRDGYAYSSGALDVDTYWGGVSVTNCHLLDNHANYLGGAITSSIYYDGGVQISNCVFSGNSADNGGGAIMLNWHFDAIASVEMDNCTFVGNSSPYGCIIYEYWLDDAWMTSPGDGGLQDYYVEFTSCTIVANSGYAINWYSTYSPPIGLSSGGSAPLQEYWMMSETIVAYNELGMVFSVEAPFMTCVDIYGNSCGDWVGTGSSQYGIRGNFSGCPSFCYAGTEDFHLCDESPCAPGNHPDSVDCGLIGAWGVGCVCAPSRTETMTWGAIKSLYE